MHDVRVHERQQPGHESPDVAASNRHRCFPYILPFMPLQDYVRTKTGRVPGQPQVSVQNRPGPPLEDHDSGTLLVEIPECPRHGTAPIPVHAVVNRYLRWIDHGASHLGAHMIPPRVKALGDKPTHQHGTSIVLARERAS